MESAGQQRIDLNLKLIILLLLVIFPPGTACGKTISICGQGCEFDSITKAINSAEPGDTIQVQSGIYFENVNISKQITLLGKDTGSGRPVIDAGGNGSAVTISADGAAVDGFNLTNSLGSWVGFWAGIEVNSNDSTIVNNLAFNNENGILISGSNNTVLRNNAANNIYGVKTKDSANNSITDNNLRSNNYGLFILSSNNNTIQRNQIAKNEFGILLNESTGNNLSHNLMMGNSHNFGCHGSNYVDTTNLADGRPIYYFVRSVNRTINSSSNAATVYCINCYNLTIKDLDLKNNLYGIYLDNTSHSLIEDNNLSDNQAGIALVNSYHNSLKGNRAAGNTEGIVLTASRYNTIHANKALMNQAGLHLAYSDYNRILENQASQSERGIWLFRSGQNLLSRNNLTYNSIGAELNFAWLNLIFDGNISSNSRGIFLDSSSNNNLSGNRIINNTEGILFDPLDNNTLNLDNQYRDNRADFVEIRSRQTAGPGIPPSISISIDSNPKDAVIINGDENLKTPGPVYFTDPGEYTVYVKKEGYKDGKLIIEIPERISRETFPESMRERSIILRPEENT